MNNHEISQPRELTCEIFFLTKLAEIFNEESGAVRERAHHYTYIHNENDELDNGQKRNKR